VDALVLAVASVIRPMSVAAVYAMLSAPRPTRLLTAYLAAGFVFSTGIGIVLVILLGIAAGPRAPEEVRAVIPFVLGAVSLSYAAGLLSGWVQAPVPDRTRATPGPDSSSWLGRQLANLSPRRAALAGVLTHKPGLFYLAALSAITNSTSSNANRTQTSRAPGLPAADNRVGLAPPAGDHDHGVRHPGRVPDRQGRRRAAVLTPSRPGQGTSWLGAPASDTR
jgi:hypothetical protein